MELIYIWVDNFRNFSDIGFNLSYNHQIKFDHLLKNLTIEKVPNDIELLFDTNLKNITAIIGKNSTGKSNFLDLVCLALKGNINSLSCNFLAIFGHSANDNVRYSIYTNLSDCQLISSNKEIVFLKSNEDLNGFNIIFFSNIADGREQNFPKSIIDVSQNKREYYQKRMINDSDILKQFKFILSDYFNKSELEIPSTIILSTRLKSNNSFRENRLRETNYEIYRTIYDKYKSRLKDTNPINHLRYSFRLSLFTFLLSGAVNETKDKRRDNLFEINPDLESLNGLLNEHLGDAVNLTIKEIHEKIERFISLLFFEFREVGEIQKNDVHFLLGFDKVIEQLNPKLIKEGKYNQSRLYYEIDLSEKNLNLLKQFLPIFNIDQVVDIDWGGISSGHKAFINIFAQLFSVLKKVNNQPSVIVCIDEGDLYLHPKWQQEFLMRLVSFIPYIFSNYIQIIITSHSPFLVSDLPRENLIFLDKDENSNCKIITSKELPQKTFGANIIDLYVNTFFLEKGTISKFALDKIKKAITIAKNENKSVEDVRFANCIKNLIGDDVISFKLNKMLSNA